MGHADKMWFSEWLSNAIHLCSRNTHVNCRVHMNSNVRLRQASRADVRKAHASPTAIVSCTVLTGPTPWHWTAGVTNVTGHVRPANSCSFRYLPVRAPCSGCLHKGLCAQVRGTAAIESLQGRCSFRRVIDRSLVIRCATVHTSSMCTGFHSRVYSCAPWRLMNES